MRKVFPVFLLLSLILLADGMIIPRPPRPGIQKKYMELIDHYADIKVVNNICRVEVKETFRNPYNFTIEGEYIFPLPRGASPSKFSMIINGEEVTGEVLEREEARRIYEDIVRRMIDPALLEYYEYNLFKASVAPIRAREKKKISLTYEYELPRKGDFYEIFYPFKIEAVSPTPIETAVISFDIKSELPMKNVFSPTHKIDLSREDKTASGAWEDNNVKPNNDFIIYYSVSQTDFDISMLDYREQGEDGYFLLGVSSPSKPEKREIIPKDVVFVMDVSGSMSGDKISQAKKGLKFIVEHLNREDRFNIIPFSTDIEPLFRGLARARPANIEKAKNLIEDMEAAGGTNINDALKSGLGLYNNDERPYYLIFLTDGLPTVGITSIKDIVNNVSNSLDNQKIFIFGVGYDVNTILLDQLAEKGRGAGEYVEPGEELEISISSFYSKIMYPAIENPGIKFYNLDVSKIHPEELGDLFYGQNIIIAGRYEDGGTAQVLLRGRKKGEKWSMEKSFSLSEINTEMDFIPLIWARKRVAYLLSQIKLHGENEELVNEVTNLGKEYGVVTPYTSYLVREDERKDMELAVPAEKARAATGMDAVKMSKKMQEMKQEVATEEPFIQSIKKIGKKVFYLKDSIYVDEKYKEDMKTVEVEFGSEKYFELIKKYPEQSRYLGVSRNLILVIEGVAYRIEE